jgi:hypothetical protein
MLGVLSYKELIVGDFGLEKNKLSRLFRINWQVPVLSNKTIKQLQLWDKNESKNRQV